MKRKTYTKLIVLLFVMLLCCAACTSKAIATTMHLIKTLGTVDVADNNGDDVAIVDDLGLYNDYQVDTQDASYAWINLDDVKLTKMDECSDVTIQKEGQKLEIFVNSGSLFFNVTEPLKDDESMNIRTSTMMVGIRGTCGWVNVPDKNHIQVYLLEGKVTCAIYDEADQEITSQLILPGQMAALVYDGENSSITVEEFDEIPDFVSEELDNMTLNDELSSTLETLSARKQEKALAEAQAKDPIYQALEQYRTIIGQADSYYSQLTTTPTGKYRYAIVQLHPNDPAPSLLLEQETADYMYYMQIFQYNPVSETLYHPEEYLTEGVALTGGYRGGIGLQEDGNGLFISEVSSGTGQTSVYRMTLDKNSLNKSDEWHGMFNEAPQNMSSQEIIWHDITDTSPLDNWTSSDIANEVGDVSEEDSVSELPHDGNRIVFTGTIDTYSYDEVITLQGCPDPNAYSSDKTATFRLIVLDTPQDMELMSGDGIRTRSAEVHMISVDYAEGLDQYDSQHLIFSIDPANTYWPSEASMPVGTPSTNDVHILS